MVEQTMPASAEGEDEKLVHKAVDHVRTILDATLKRGLEEVGVYLLETFYGNDPALYFSVSQHKHASISLLLSYCGSMALPVSRTFIANALRIAATARLLPKGSSFHRLPPSHRVELVRFREPEQIEKLASRAVEKELSVEKLRELVHKEHERQVADGPRRGRRPTPIILRMLSVCMKTLRNAETGRLAATKGDLKDLNDDQREQATKELEVLEKRVGELRALFE